MKIQTTRFGEIEVAEDKIINFPNGLIGFESLKQFSMFNKEENSCFWWLQSVEKPEIAFLLAEPHNILPNYNPVFSQEEMGIVEAISMDEIELSVILTIPADPRETTANLIAPIALNTAKRIGAQIVLKDNRYTTRHLIAQPVVAGT